MTLAHRALFTWFIVLVFLIFLCLRLDPRATTWNWFVTFTPLWFFDCIYIIYVIIKFIRKWRNLKRLKVLLFLYKWNIGGVLLTITSQVMICLVLEYPQIPGYVALLPVCLTLAAAAAGVLQSILARSRL